MGYALCRKNVDTPSSLERMCLEAQQLADKSDGTTPSTPNNVNSKLNPANHEDESDGTQMSHADCLFFEKLKLVMERSAFEYRDQAISLHKSQSMSHYAQQPRK